MKRILVIGVLFFYLSSFSQKHEATLYFRDGTIEKGLAEIKKGDIIRFKSQANPKIIVYYNSLKVKELTLRKGEITTKYQYKILTDGKKNLRRPYLLEPVVIGNLSLYKDVKKMAGGGGGGFVNTGGGGQAYIGGGNGRVSEITIYYANKNNSNFVTHIASPRIYSKKLKKKKKELEYFKSATHKYFKNCPELLSKFDSYEYVESNSIIDIIKFYNTNCSNK